jgi:transcriptional regulator with XRE-family HTH domain
LIPSRVALLLRREREAAQLELEEAAEALDVSPLTLRYWECTGMIPRGHVLTLLNLYQSSIFLLERIALKVPPWR